jgi:hypothetical protein
MREISDPPHRYEFWITSWHWYGIIPGFASEPPTMLLVGSTSLPSSKGGKVTGLNLAMSGSLGLMNFGAEKEKAQDAARI